MELDLQVARQGRIALSGHDAARTLSTEHEAFIKASPLILLFSGRPDATPDVSPRGDLPGFVRVLDGRRLQLPDRVGNNRIDSIRNTLADPRVAFVFLAAGDQRMLTVQGRARVLADSDLLASFEHNGRKPRSVMEVEVESAELSHCAALSAAAFWQPDLQAARGGIASLGQILAEQVGGLSKEQGEAFVANSYTNKLY